MDELWKKKKIRNYDYKEEEKTGKSIVQTSVLIKGMGMPIKGKQTLK